MSSRKRLHWEPLVTFMESQGFVTLHRSPGYSNHRHSDPSRGRVDFMYVRSETAEKLFASARSCRVRRRDLFTGAKPEHLIAMKVQAMKDAPNGRGRIWWTSLICFASTV